ncbi:MgtC/SapB family protein [Lacticaseibacillus saniviri]|jgi:putative Mg2+ transporter-C (MgtC) family protein|uniref:Cation transport ATPase n=1 Tax=Lacticaseibacillus saniviri JCM 17471 = DSM 24301 TaxID=1293598 RepID=A0A0R2MVB3_9LACO|nr:MgtC/SapB family protein [Lacticaseibacillus saniviri]KRO15539.1 cation transport ATPase [Lacticaseibacillus saniviri JCM 17471 = DSM 24301]
MALQTQAELILRLFVAAFCGFAIGYERKNRQKEAGIRTHMIVALGAALVMIVSKYGFFDIYQLKGMSLDPSRVAAQVVSGVSFLGAGAILVRRNNVNGLTTAAGVWTTAAVGMAIGAKLYLIGLATTLLVLAIQILLHRNFSWLPSGDTGTLTLIVNGGGDEMKAIQKTLGRYHIKVHNVRIKQETPEQLRVALEIEANESGDVRRLLSVFADNPAIVSVEY